FICNIYLVLNIWLISSWTFFLSTGSHSLTYFLTAVSGDIDFPEFSIVGLKVVPKTVWMKQKEGADYWDTQTLLAAGTQHAFRNNNQVTKDWFNRSTCMNTFINIHRTQSQNTEMYGCEWDDQTGKTNGFRREGYDGEDFMSLDLKEMRWTSPAVWRKQASLRMTEMTTALFEWLKKYLQYGKNRLQRTVSPQVSLLQKSSSSSVTCHATGFYPSGVTISWMRNGQDHDEDVDLSELLPNKDGTFQKMSTITVTPDEWKKNKFSCVVEHQGKTKTANEIRTNNADSAPIGIIVGVVVVAVVLLMVIEIR
uniref:Ig-like domain-containing protein n=1 Tax=Sinocyclocheilus rhinocerous TaxID=307959 RepID=A0A673GRX8_9TELE